MPQSLFQGVARAADGTGLAVQVRGEGTFEGARHAYFEERRPEPSGIAMEFLRG
jgi:hypothetical protein